MLYSTSRMKAIRMFSSGNAYMYVVCAEIGKASLLTNFDYTVCMGQNKIIQHELSDVIINNYKIYYELEISIAMR